LDAGALGDVVDDRERSTGQLVSKVTSSARQGLDHLIGEIEELRREHAPKTWQPWAKLRRRATR
jgi:hypothetical protein